MKSSLRIRFLQITSSLLETESFLLMMLVISSIVMKEENHLNQLQDMTPIIFSTRSLRSFKDNVFTDERQFSIVNLIQDNNLGIPMSIRLLRPTQDLVSMIMVELLMVGI